MTVVEKLTRRNWRWSERLLDCQLCSQPMRHEGKVELFMGISLAQRLLVRADWWGSHVVEMWKCPACGYIVLMGEPDKPASRPLPPEITICAECGARNFKRQECRVCGVALPQADAQS